MHNMDIIVGQVRLLHKSHAPESVHLQKAESGCKRFEDIIYVVQYYFAINPCSMSILTNTFGNLRSNIVATCY